MKKYTLRNAISSDAEFLFNTKELAMQSSLGLPNNKADYVEYLKQFEPDKIQVIQYKGKDIGRLRIVRDSNSIYIGGIQILPKYQNLAIGSAILNDLIEESKANNMPITLEVHKTNQKGIHF